MISSGDMVGSGDEINETITSEDTYILTGLSVINTYLVEVAATTINGTGPFSAPVIAMPTYEGKCKEKHQKVYYIMLVTFTYVTVLQNTDRENLKNLSH